jgi:hypothetical protein
MYTLTITREGIELLNKLTRIVEKEDRFTKEDAIDMVKLMNALNEAADPDNGSVEINVYK